MSIGKDLCVAMADDLNSSAGLVDHLTVTGRRPRAILPESCPLLVVWLDNKLPSPESTERFDGQMTFGISWHEQAVEEAKTLVNNPELTWSLMDHLEKIEARIRQWAKATPGNVAAAWQILPGASTYIGPIAQQGLTEGYAVEAVASVTEV